MNKKLILKGKRLAKIKGLDKETFIKLTMTVLYQADELTKEQWQGIFDAYCLKLSRLDRHISPIIFAKEYFKFWRAEVNGVELLEKPIIKPQQEEATIQIKKRS